jgi:hypothetical protein
MSVLPRITLAVLLEKLFNLDNNPQLKTLLVLSLLGLGIWFMSLDKLPTGAEALATARQAAGSGVVVQKRLTIRKQFAIAVLSNGRLVQQTFWSYCYPPAIVANTAISLTPEHWQRLSLEAYAQVGDSIWKQPGSLFVQVKRGTTTRIFQYRNPYP